jgi:hypothetical protein
MNDDYKDRRYHEEDEEDMGEAIIGAMIFAIIVLTFIYLF